MARIFEVLESVCANEFVKRTPEEIKSSLRFICKMLTNYFESGEQQGVGFERPHRALTSAAYIEKVVLDISLPIRRELDASAIHLACYSNMTVWELKALVAQHVDASALCLSFKRGENKLVEINENSNMKLLSDLRLSEGETIHVHRAKDPDIVEVPLIDKRGEVAPELNGLFEEWFKRFSAVRSKQLILAEIVEKLAPPSPLPRDD